LLLVAVVLFALVIHDGEAHWFHGQLLLALYVMIAVVAFALPGR